MGAWVKIITNNKSKLILGLLTKTKKGKSRMRVSRRVAACQVSFPTSLTSSEEGWVSLEVLVDLEASTSLVCRGLSEEMVSITSRTL